MGLLAPRLLAACAGQVSFLNVTPGNPLRVTGQLYRPAGLGPSPALVLLHGCAGVQPHNQRWAKWITERGYVALVVDSWTPRGVAGDCRPGTTDPKNTERFDDAFGALRYLLLLIGEADDRTLARTCKEMVDAMRAKGADASVTIFPGAYHYFDNVDYPLQVLPDVENRYKPGGCCGATVGYDPQAATAAFAEVEAFLARHLHAASSRCFTNAPSPDPVAVCEARRSGRCCTAGAAQETGRQSVLSAPTPHYHVRSAGSLSLRFFAF